MHLKNKYYIEFVGAHGAGKTFTYHVIAKQQLLKPYTSLYPGQIKRLEFHFLLSCPFIAIKNILNIIFVLKFFCKYSRFTKINLKVLTVLIKMIILHQYYFRYDFNFFLKDDMLHMLQRIVFRAQVNIEEAFREYFVHFQNKYSGIIFVDIDKKTMLKRFKKRFPGKSKTFKENRAIIHERVKKQSKFLRKVIITQKNTPYLILNGNDDVNKNAQKVISFCKANIIEN